MKFHSNLDTLATVQQAATEVTFRPITSTETLVFGLREEHYSTCGQFGVADISCGRGEGVLLCRDRHLIVMLFEPNGCCTVYDSFHIPEKPEATQFRYLQVRGGRNPAGYRAVKEVPAEHLNDTDFAMRVPGASGDASEIEADAWYKPEGYFRMSFSEEYPVELLGQAMLAAYRVVQREADKLYGQELARSET